MKKETQRMLDGIAYLRTLGYKTFFYHLPTKQNCRITFCEIARCADKAGNAELFIGRAKKSPKDSPNLKIARFVAFQRAIRNFNF